MIRIKNIYFFLVVLITTFSCQNKAAKPAVKEAEKQKKAIIKDDAPKVFLITLDGLRWQELFTGADDKLVNSDYTKAQDMVKETFWDASPQKRRKKLMPFFWSTIANQGQIYGNRSFGNTMNLTNTHWFSYPGYSEILCGFADDKRINSNDKNNNPNETILETVNNLPEFKGKVGAFGSWDVFPFIINEDRSELYVNAGYKKAKGNLTDNEKYLNHLQDQAIRPWESVRQDVFTHNYALEFIKKEHPKLVYISYGETDDFAHDGDYTHYLLAAKNTDAMIKELWNYCQSDDFYKGKTTFIITTDHGRGTKPLEAWKSHGQNLKYHGKTYNIDGSDETWIAVLGAGISSKGEVKTKQDLKTNQVAATVLDFLGAEKVKTDKMGESLKETFK